MAHSWRICPPANRDSLAGALNGTAHILGQISLFPVGMPAPMGNYDVSQRQLRHRESALASGLPIPLF